VLGYVEMLFGSLNIT